MGKEIEIRFINVDKGYIREMLNKLGAVCKKKETLMRRMTFDFKAEKKPGYSKWARVRDEGDKITMTIKEVTNSADINGTNEIEITTSDFDKSCEFLTSCELIPGPYQENYRESWEYKNCHISIDTWPMLEPFVEIEGDSQEVVKKVTEELGFDYEKGMFGNIPLVYKSVLDMSVDDFLAIKILKFKNQN